MFFKMFHLPLDSIVTNVEKKERTSYLDSHYLVGDVSYRAVVCLAAQGTIGSVTIQAGGTHAPGNSIGTQTIAGDYVNHVLSDRGHPTSTGKLIVTGNVDISGATLDLLLTPAPSDGWSLVNGPLLLISKESAGAVTGTFSSVNNNLLFLNHSLDYGTEWGNLALRSGLAYAWHDIEAGRSVAIGGFADRFSAEYDAGTFQAFGEAGHKLAIPAASFEPFLNLAARSPGTPPSSRQGSTSSCQECRPWAFPTKASSDRTINNKASMQTSTSGSETDTKEPSSRQFAPRVAEIGSINRRQVAAGSIALAGRPRAS